METKMDINFPDEADKIVDEVLKRYGLYWANEEGIKKVSETTDPTEKSRIFYNLPGTKLWRLLKQCAQGQIPLEALPEWLTKELNVNRAEAIAMKNELEKVILSADKPTEEKKVSKPSSETRKPPLPPEIPPNPEISPEPKIPPKPDLYREPIE